MKRKMIIVWKWSASKLGESKSDEIGVNNCPNDIIIRIRHQENKRVDNKKKETTKKEIGQRLTKKEGFEIILFLHDITTNGVFGEKDRNFFQQAYPKIEVCLFGGGKDPIYKTEHADNKGLLSEHESFFSTVLCNEKVVKQDNFNFVWNEYYEKKPLIEKKNHLIRKLLPLAIDIQGLSEVDSNKREEYFNDIITSSTDNTKEIRGTLEDMKKEEIEIDDIEECVKFLNFFSNKEVDLEKFYEKYCNSKNSEFFLPTWLQNLANKFDEKIEQY